MIINTINLWEDRDDVQLTTFMHLQDPFLGKGKKRPAVIVCAGGAYQSCSRHGNEGDPVAMTFAADGYHAFVLEYSVAERAPEGKTLFPAQIIDLGKAFLTLYEHAEEWSIDTDKITIVGFSAGGHLCSMYATTWNNGLLSDIFGVDSQIFKPMAALVIYGIHDYVLQEDANSQVPDGPFGAWNSPVFGCEKPDKEILIKNSPVYHVSQDTPPMFLAAAANDGLVPAMHTLKMAEKLQEMHVPYECHMFQYGDHGFSLGRNVFEPYREDLKHACAEWVPLAKVFLMHLLSEDSLKPEADPFEGLSFEEFSKQIKD